MVINNTMPFFKMLFAQLILGEKVGKQPLVCIFAGRVSVYSVFGCLQKDLRVQCFHCAH